MINDSTTFLLESNAIRNAVSELATNAVSVRILTAWATTGVGLECLRGCKPPHLRAIVGTCFAVTEPKALNVLAGLGFDLRVIEALPKGGTFHPKVYVFDRADGGCTALIGSANLTDSAFTRNSEAMVRIETSQDGASAINDYFDKFWNHRAARKVDDAWYANYRDRYETQKSRDRDMAKAERPKRSRAKPTNTVITPSEINELMRSDWSSYLKSLRANVKHATIDGEHDSYLRMFEVVGEILRNGLADADRADLSRATGLTDGWGWCGSVHLMKGEAAQFYRDRSLRKRVDDILATVRNVQSEDDCIEAARRVFERLRRISGFGHGFITRMLAIAKPDRFYSVNGRCEHRLAQLLTISMGELRKSDGYERGLEQLYKTKWYQSQPPTDPLERRAWGARVALIDAYAYQPKAIG